LEGADEPDKEMKQMAKNRLAYASDFVKPTPQRQPKPDQLTKYKLIPLFHKEKKGLCRFLVLQIKDHLEGK
jgi:hypothetical protein